MTEYERVTTADLDELFSKVFAASKRTGPLRLWTRNPVPCIWTDRAGNEHKIYSFATYMRLVQRGLAPTSFFTHLYNSYLTHKRRHGHA